MTQHKAPDTNTNIDSTPNEWRPKEPLEYSPIFQFSKWTPQTLLKYYFSYGGYLIPWNTFYYLLAYVTFYYWNPPLEKCKNFSFDWIIFLFLRNQILLWVIAGGFHLVLYQFKVDGTKNKYDPDWQSTNNSKFLFKDQVYDNIFWCCTSGTIIWTFYESVFLYLWANNKIPYYSSLSDYPVWSLFLTLIIPYWREFHFFWIHGMTHWPPLYKTVHYLHHKNYNPGPWSGIAMHPIEHILYFSMLLIHMFIWSHPFHLFLNSQLTALTPAGGHIGFHGPIWNESLPTGSYFHYLHHRYYECNYGESNVPLDKMMGTFYDGKNKKPKLQKNITMFLFMGFLLGILPVGYFCFKLLW